MNTCEMIAMAIMTILTSWNVWESYKNSRILHKDMSLDIFIDGELLHSQQHFAIFVICGFISVLMYITMWASIGTTFAEHMFFNLACVLIIYPHLAGERKQFVCRNKDCKKYS